VTFDHLLPEPGDVLVRAGWNPGDLESLIDDAFDRLEEADHDR
jgi:hypothetical protein